MHDEPASGSHLLTIGYQGRTLPEVVRRLRVRDVRLLVDVRKVARSRRPEFNHWRLAEALNGAGIEYKHAPALGSPSSLRRLLYETGDFDRFAGLYLAYVRRWQMTALAGLTRLVRKNGRVCILCYETDAMSCHRHIVAAEAIRARGGSRLIVEHIV